MPNRKASSLKRQKGVCSWCGLNFRERDLLETNPNRCQNNNVCNYS